MQKKLKIALLGWLLVFLCVPWSNSAQVRDVRFADSLHVAETELSLTGVAVLKWALLFDVYAGAFYLPTADLVSNWTDDIPKRLELYYFRSFTAADFSKSSDKLLRDSLAPEEYRTIEGRLQIFYRLFRDIKSGDRYSLTYQPGIGTELRLNGELLGAVSGLDFAVAYFGLWLGPKPINEAFRDRLLGGRR